MQLYVVTFVELFVDVFIVLLLIRVIVSYVANPHGRFSQSIVGVTEPLLAPVRRLLPQTAGLDLAPLAAFLLLQLFRYLVRTAAGV